MIERKIYNGWAFKENEKEKSEINMSIYKELKQKYKIGKEHFDNRLNQDDYDIILRRKVGYNHSTYKIVKNTPNLNIYELALIADDGNLCFGFTLKMGDIYIFED